MVISRFTTAIQTTPPLRQRLVLLLNKRQDLPGVTRTHSFCGLEGKAEFAQCAVFISCFDDYNTLYDWSTCIETQVRLRVCGALCALLNLFCIVLMIIPLLVAVPLWRILLVLHTQVHASMHGVLGGGFNCNVSMVCRSRSRVVLGHIPWYTVTCRLSPVRNISSGLSLTECLYVYFASSTVSCDTINTVEVFACEMGCNADYVL